MNDIGTVIGIPATPYIRPVVTAVEQLEYELTKRYDRNWRLRIERESPGVWRCRWDILTPDGEVLGGSSESFTVNT
jgi:hypothetical protein